MKESEKEQVYVTALRLFRVLNGDGDGGRESSFHAINPAFKDRWMKLGKMFKKERDSRISCDRLIAGIKATNPPLKSLSAIIEEVIVSGHADIFHDDTWNEEATVKISLTIRELRRINEFVESLKAIYTNRQENKKERG